MEEQEKINNYFRDTPQKAHEIVSLAREGKKIYRQLDKLCRKGAVDKQAYAKVLKRVKRNRKKIEGNPNYELMRESMVEAEQIIRSGQYFERETIEEEGIELARQGQKYMELLEECADIVEQVAKETVGKAGLEAE